MFWEIAGAHRICPEVHYPVPEFATLAGGDWVHRIPRALAALGVGLYNPIACPRTAHVQLQSPPGNIVRLRTAKLQHRDTYRLAVPHALVHLFHTTGTRDPRLRLVHPTRSKQDAHTGPRVTPDGLHLHVGGYRRRDGLSPPTRGAAYHPPAALMYILSDVLAESEHQEPTGHGTPPWTREEPRTHTSNTRA